MHWTDRLTALDACEDAIAWARTQPDPQTAWDACTRGDWMLWWAGHCVDRRELVLAACDCAETAADYADDETQMAIVWTIETTRMWARGEGGIDLDDVRAAAAAAYAADYAVTAAAHTAYAVYAAAAGVPASSAAYAAAGVPASSAAYAATAATAADYAADAAAYAADAAAHTAAAAAAAEAAYAAAYAADAAAREASRAASADICREHWPIVPTKEK